MMLVKFLELERFHSHLNLLAQGGKVISMLRAIGNIWSHLLGVVYCAQSPGCPGCEPGNSMTRGTLSC